jgi:nucleotide-binding universal stress UspA family protein
MIPIDFSVNTEVAIKKAIDIVADQEVDIHLFHVCKPSLSDVSFGRAGITEKEIEAEIKLKEWKESVEQYLPSAQVFYWIIPASSVQEAIIEKAQKLKSDLLVVGKKSNHYLLPMLNTVVSSVLAKKTGCAVLTVKPGSLHNRIKKVVVPVTSNDAEHKMNALSALCKKYRPKIFLVTFSEQGSDVNKSFSSAFLKIYQWIHAKMQCPVEHTILYEANKTKAVLNFSEKLDADVLLLQPEEETKMGWMGQHIYDYIPSGSKVQVLTV